MKNPLEILRSINLSKVEDESLKKEVSNTKEVYVGKNYNDLSKVGKENIDTIVELVKDIYPKALPTDKKEPAQKPSKKGTPVNEKTVKVGDVVANTNSKYIVHIRDIFDDNGGDVRTSDGVVPFDDLEVYSETIHKDYFISPSTQKEIDSKKKPSKKKPSKKKAAPKKKGTNITTVNGKEYDMDDCDEAQAAVEARRKQRQSSDRKYEKRPDTTKAKKNLDAAIGQIGDAIKKGATPAQVEKALKGFKLKMNGAFDELEPVLNKEQIKRLKSSFSTIDEVIKEIKNK